MTRTYSKDDVEFHSLGFSSNQQPAVNVKIYKTLNDVELPINLGGSHPVGKPEEFQWHYTDPEFTVDWVEDNLTEEQIQGTWDLMCESGWEYLQQIAEEIWPDIKVKVYAEGRSGGWAVVEGLPDFEYWNAIELGRWRRFEKIAKAVAADVPHQVMVSIYINEFEEPEE
jgi:hypothetical protein